MHDGPLVAEPSQGRVFRGARPVRLSDADPSGRARLDACARYLHDLSNDDTRDAALPDDGSWVVRRTVLDVAQPLRYQERLETSTWCGGTGSRWAERRVSLVGHRGGSVEAAALWVYVDLSSFMPKRITQAFLDLYGEAAAGRQVGSKLELPAPADGDDVRERPWPLRRTDLDLLDHVNNAAYWCAVEELVGERPELVAGPHRAVVEFAKQVSIDDPVTLRWVDDPDGIRAWLQVDGTTHAAMALHRR